VDDEGFDLAESRQRPTDRVEVALAVLAGVSWIGMKRFQGDACDDKRVQAMLLFFGSG
jgi:hypothetical protein